MVLLGGTPRVANRLLRRVRDFAEVEGDGTVTVDVARGALGKLDAAGWNKAAEAFFTRG